MQRLSLRMVNQPGVLTATRRSYTDYQHFKYPKLFSIAYGVPAVWLFTWFFFVRIGHVNTSTGANSWKKKTQQALYRYSGYKWGNEVFEGETLNNIFVNLPEEVQ